MFDAKTEEEYRQIVNSFLDVNPFRRLSDFEVVIEGLSAILRTFPLREMPPHLSSYFAPIVELAQTPGKHPNPTHSIGFNNIVIELIRKKEMLSKAFLKISAVKLWSTRI